MNPIAHWANTEMGFYLHAPEYGLRGFDAGYGRNRNDSQLVLAIILSKMERDLTEEEVKELVMAEIANDYLLLYTKSELVVIGLFENHFSNIKKL